MFHIELRESSAEIAHAFNISRGDLERRIIEPWTRVEPVELNDRRWDPKRVRLTIYMGRPLHTAELGLGRGWGNAIKFGTDVTESELARARDAPPVQVPRPPLSASASAELSAAEVGREILAACASTAIGLEELPALLATRLAHRRVSERLALVEQAVWELLQRGRVELVRGGEPIDRAELESILLSWDSWTGTAFPPILVLAL